jgi:predicted nucleic acid-binding protein
MSNITHIKNHNPTSTDNYFFDCNVWMHLMGIIGNVNPNKQNAYSGLLKRIQHVRASIFINSLILSEYCNLYLRTEFSKWRNEQPRRSAPYDFKRDFTKTAYYSGCVECLINSLERIYKLTHFCSDNLTRFSIDKLHANLSLCDFNDSYYLHLCETDNYKFVTDDADCLKDTLDCSAIIVTDNTKLP